MRRLMMIAGALLVSGGIVTVALALASQLDSTIALGLLVIIIGMQMLTLAYVVRLLAMDWPPAVLFAAGVDRGIERERERQARERREDLGIVVPMRERDRAQQ